MTIRVREFDGKCDKSADDRSDLSSEQITEVVQQLNSICRSSSLEFALRAGAVIIHHFYCGDTDAWRSRGPKVNSFRRLAEHPELALSAGALYRCVAIFEMCDRLRAASRWRRLGASHLRTVIGLPSCKQESLLNRANEERWSVQMLQAEAQSLRVNRTRGGRRARSTLDRRLRTVDRCLQDWGAALDSVDLHEPEELEHAVELLKKMKASLEEIAEAVELRLAAPEQ